VTRYDRQILLPQISASGQEKLRTARVLLVGCGALGSVIAEQLVRAGIGELRLCDRDIVELTNLQRQVLFTEDDARNGMPKAVAAAARLREINGSVRIMPQVADVAGINIESLVLGTAGSARADILIDGTDNAETRYLINDAAVKHAVPWVYGACIGMGGRVLGIVPGKTACLRCVFPMPPGPGEIETCDTAGVFAPAAAIVASLQVATAVKILLGEADSLPLTTIDVWTPRFRTVLMTDGRRRDCPACGQRLFEFLDGASVATTVLCGRETVQVRPMSSAVRLDPDQVERRLLTAGDVQRTPFLIRCVLREGGLKLTVFMDGRALIHGTSDMGIARSTYARYIGA
jgi:adenylyltransferase/sulfurtransferase